MTGFLLDTNVISEIRKKRPNPQVLAFVSGVPKGTLYLSCLTLGELRTGVELKRAKDALAADALASWVDGLEFDYGDSTLAIDTEITKLWGTWSAERSRPIVDTLMAATAYVHELVFVTRNLADVQDLPIKLLNPLALNLLAWLRRLFHVVRPTGAYAGNEASAFFLVIRATELVRSSQ